MLPYLSTRINIWMNSETVITPKLSPLYLIFSYISIKYVVICSFNSECKVVEIQDFSVYKFFLVTVFNGLVCYKFRTK